MNPEDALRVVKQAVEILRQPVFRLTAHEDRVIMEALKCLDDAMKLTKTNGDHKEAANATSTG